MVGLWEEISGGLRAMVGVAVTATITPLTEAPVLQMACTAVEVEPPSCPGEGADPGLSICSHD